MPPCAPPPTGERRAPFGKNYAPNERNPPGATMGWEGFAIKTFFFLWFLTPTLMAKLLCVFPKLFMPPKRATLTANLLPAAMLTKPTKSAQPNKLTVSIMLTLLSLPAMPTDSSVAGGGGGGDYSPPPIGLPTKMQNKKNTTFLALLRLSFALD